MFKDIINPLEVVCPDCKAAAGERCKSSAGYFVPSHPSRLAEISDPVCGRPHVAKGLSCNESRLAEALADKFLDPPRSAEDAAGGFEAIAAVIRGNRGRI